MRKHTPRKSRGGGSKKGKSSSAYHLFEDLFAGKKDYL
jgi:hypothetical protein